MAKKPKSANSCFFTDFMKFQIPIEFEPLKIEQKNFVLYLGFKGLAIH